jgi:hypothetical protein
MQTIDISPATKNDYISRVDARREQMLRELASDLAYSVQCGEMSEVEANEWYSMKADQWASES